MAQNIAKKKKTAREQKRVTKAKVYILATFNNILVTVTDKKGQTLVWGSAGRAGFKGARKSTPFAATTTVDKVSQEAKGLGVSEIEVYIKGPGSGRDAALRALRANGFNIVSIADVTPLPHNGPRPKKRRRV